MRDVGNVGKTEIKSMVQIYNTIKKNGLIGKGDRVVVFSDCDGVVLEVGNMRKELGDMLCGISWPVQGTGKKAYKISIPGIFDVPFTMWGFWYMYVNRGVRWVTDDSTVSILCLNPGNDYLALMSHAMPYGTGWKKVSVSPNLMSILKECEYCVQAGSSISSISMDDGNAIFSFHTYGAPDKRIPYGTNSTFNGIMEDIVREIDTTYSKIDISKILWYNSDANHNRGFIKRTEDGDYEFLIV